MNNLLNNIYVPVLLFAMIFFHILDDYCLQGILAHMKQKKWWENKNKFYENDYKIALVEHAFSWSFSIHIPIIMHILYCEGYYNSILLVFSIIINCVIHAIVDDLKANKYKINLIQDQTIHIIQIIITWIIYAYNF